ncbi:MAG: glycoside hydrolase family 125 protein [Limnochordales bacterium]
MEQAKLTVPEELKESVAYFPTGNEYVALPLVNEGGAVESFNVLHMRCKGMVEFYGTPAAPLLVPVVRVDGRELEGTHLTWERLEHWLPRFVGEGAGVRVTGLLCAPPGRRGFVYTLRVENVGAKPVTVEWGWRGEWASARQAIYRSRPLHGRRTAWYDRWTDTLAFELAAGPAVAGFALGASKSFRSVGWRLATESEQEDVFLEALARRGGPGAEQRLRVDNENGEAICFAVATETVLQPGRAAELDLYVGVNAESDGACTAVVDLQRRGAKALVEEARAWLQRRMRPVADEELGARTYLNLWFNYFFAAGRTIDTDELVLVTSRSPRYYVSAAFWARDAYLWSFPGVLLLDPERAREMVLVGFGRYLRNVAEHSLYIDGSVLYPGFELDELCAPILALEQYVQATDDYSVLEEVGLGGTGRVVDGLAYLEKRLEEQRHPERNLYATFLSPTDDPATHPFLTYDNVLAWRALRALAHFKRRRGDSLGEWRANQQAVQLRETLRRHAVVEGFNGPMFAWALDERRRAQLLDQPPGSLQLLAYYGFCEPDDPVYVNTVNWIHSSRNPDYFPGKFGAPGCAHAPHPWPLMVAYDVLLGRDLAAGLEFFRRAPMDNGIVCETVDRHTGVVKTGAAFASAAGFVGYALYRALTKP